MANRQSVNGRATLSAQCHYIRAVLSSAQRHVMGCCKARAHTDPRGNYSFVRWTPIFVGPHYGVGRDSVVVMETRYGLGVPGIESRLGRDFLQLSRPTQGHIQPRVQWLPDVFPTGKATGAWRLTTHSNRGPRLQKEYTLYHNSTSGPS
jgi:hypothetical protein